MLPFHKWMKLQESLGSVTLGMGKPQNMGIVKSDKFKNDSDLEDDDNIEDDDLEGDDVEGDEDSDLEDSDENELDQDDSLDSEDQIGDDNEDEDENDDEDEDHLSIKKNHGEPHVTGPFMKKESCNDDDDEEEEEEVTDNNDEDKDNDDMKKDKEIPMMMKKKSKKMKKKCSDGSMKCKKCKKCDKGDEIKMAKKETTDAFLSALNKSHGNVPTRYSSGLTEDMLITKEEEPKPGDPGFSPATRIGESIEALIKKVEFLEEKLKNK